MGDDDRETDLGQRGGEGVKGASGYLVGSDNVGDEGGISRGEGRRRGG